GETPLGVAIQTTTDGFEIAISWKDTVNPDTDDNPDEEVTGSVTITNWASANPTDATNVVSTLYGHAHRDRDFSHNSIGSLSLEGNRLVCGTETDVYNPIQVFDREAYGDDWYMTGLIYGIAAMSTSKLDGQFADCVGQIGDTILASNSMSDPFDTTSEMYSSDHATGGVYVYQQLQLTDLVVNPSSDTPDGLSADGENYTVSFQLTDMDGDVLDSKILSYMRAYQSTNGGWGSGIAQYDEATKTYTASQTGFNYDGLGEIMIFTQYGVTQDEEPIYTGSVDVFEYLTSRDIEDCNSRLAIHAAIQLLTPDGTNAGEHIAVDGDLLVVSGDNKLTTYELSSTTGLYEKLFEEAIDGTISSLTILAALGSQFLVYAMVPSAAPTTVDAYLCSKGASSWESTRTHSYNHASAGFGDQLVTGGSTIVANSPEKLYYMNPIEATTYAALEFPSEYTATSTAPRIAIGGDVIAMTSGTDSYAYVINITDTEPEWQRLYVSTGTASDVAVKADDSQVAISSVDTVDDRDDITGSITFYEYDENGSNRLPSWHYDETIWGEDVHYYITASDMTEGLLNIEYYGEALVATNPDSSEGAASVFYYTEEDGQSEWTLTYNDLNFMETVGTAYGATMAVNGDYTFVTDTGVNSFDSATQLQSGTSTGGVYVYVQITDELDIENDATITDFTVTDEEGTLVFQLTDGNGAVIETPIVPGQMSVYYYLDGDGESDEGYFTEYTFDTSAFTYTFAITMPSIPGDIDINVLFAAQEHYLFYDDFEYTLELGIEYTTTDLTALSTVDETCAEDTLTFTLFADGVATTTDLSDKMSAVWDDTDETSNVVSYNSLANSYYVAVVAPTTAGEHTLSVKIGSTVLGTDTATVAVVPNVANSAATFVLPGNALLSDGISFDGDFTFSMTPKDGCDATIETAAVDFTICNVNVTPNVCFSGTGFTLSSEDPVSFTSTEFIEVEGPWTYTTFIDGTQIHAATIDIAPTFVTVGTDTVGVSASLSTLTGLPTSTDEAYTASLVINDVYGNPVDQDLSPVITWDGSVVSPTWVTGTKSYLITGSSANIPESYAITVTVNSVEIVSEAVATTYGITTSLDLSVDHTCQTEHVTFTLIKNGATYTTDMSSLLVVGWEYPVTYPITYDSTDSSYSFDPVVSSTPGTHTLTLTLDSDEIAQDVTVYTSGVDVSVSSMSLSAASVLIDETFSVYMNLIDYCSAAMGSTNVDVTVSDGTHTMTETARPGNTYMVDFAFGYEGLYTVTSVAVLADGAYAPKDTSDDVLFTDTIAIGPVVVGDTSLSSVQTAITGLPTSTNEEFTASLVIKDVAGETITTDLSPEVRFNGVVMDSVWVATTTSYTISGTSGKEETTYDVTVSFGSVTLLTAPVTLEATFPWAIVIGGAVLVAIIIAIVVYCTCIRTAKAPAQKKGESDADAKAKAMEGGEALVGGSNPMHAPVCEEVPLPVAPLAPVSTPPVDLLPSNPPEGATHQKCDSAPASQLDDSSDDSSVGFEGEIDCDFHVVVEDDEGNIAQGVDEAGNVVTHKALEDIPVLEAAAEDNTYGEVDDMGFARQPSHLGLLGHQQGQQEQ
ncbi:hypothetical protein KIPB_005890, partial [Kipferlia bialata]